MVGPEGLVTSGGRYRVLDAANSQEKSSRSSLKLDYICYGNNIETLTDTATYAQRDPPCATQGLRRALDTTSWKRHVHLVPPSERNNRAQQSQLSPPPTTDHPSARPQTSTRIRAHYPRPTPTVPELRAGPVSGGQ